MKKKLFFLLVVIVTGIVFTTSVLNKDFTYAKESLMAYALQIGAYKNYDNAQNIHNSISHSIVVEDNNLYKVYVGIYENVDLVNKMLVYYENSNVPVHLKHVNITKDFSYALKKFEKILLNSDDEKVYKKVNEAILNYYKESLNKNENIT